MLGQEMCCWWVRGVVDTLRYFLYINISKTSGMRLSQSLGRMIVSKNEYRVSVETVMEIIQVVNRSLLEYW
jgi:hypothetical protein